MWMHFGIKDLIDVLLVAFFLYQTYKLMKSSGTLAIFSGVVSFIVVWILVSQVLEMRLMGAILDKFISVGFVVLVILFQDEIRRFLLALGSHRGWKFLGKLFSKRGADKESEGKFVAPVVLACMNMARKKTGALIVIEQKVSLRDYERTGIDVDGIVTSQLLINIFEHNTPLHDGAVIVRGNRVASATCYLPLSDNLGLSKELGTRHRAGVGISEVTDSLTVIVSEETGKISVAYEGKLERNLDAETLRDRMHKILNNTGEEHKNLRIWKGRSREKK